MSEPSAETVPTRKRTNPTPVAFGGAKNGPVRVRVELTEGQRSVVEVDLPKGASWGDYVDLAVAAGKARGMRNPLLSRHWIVEAQ